MDRDNKLEKDEIHGGLLLNKSIKACALVFWSISSSIDQKHMQHDLVCFECPRLWFGIQNNFIEIGCCAIVVVVVCFILNRIFIRLHIMLNVNNQSSDLPVVWKHFFLVKSSIKNYFFFRQSYYNIHTRICMNWKVTNIDCERQALRGCLKIGLMLLFDFQEKIHLFRIMFTRCSTAKTQRNVTIEPFTRLIRKKS